MQITIEKKQLTDIGESAPILLSRKKEAVSIEATINITGFAFSDDEMAIGGSADQTLSLQIMHTRGKVLRIILQARVSDPTDKIMSDPTHQLLEKGKAKTTTF